MHAPDYYSGLWNQFVERLPGVSLDWTGLYSSWEPSKEKLYELDSDIHLADPAWIAKQDNWDREDFEEIATNVSPWFGNSLSDRHAEPPSGWGDYEYYTLWEQFELVAEAFQEQARYEALAAVHDEMRSTIDANLPPESERPSAVLLAAADLDEIYAYTLDNPGFLTAHTRPFGARDAFEARSRRTPWSTSRRCLRRTRTSSCTSAGSSRTRAFRSDGRRLNPTRSDRKSRPYRTTGSTPGSEISGSDTASLPTGDDRKATVSRAVRRMADVH